MRFHLSYKQLNLPDNDCSDLTFGHKKATRIASGFICLCVKFVYSAGVSSLGASSCSGAVNGKSGIALGSTAFSIWS